MFLVIIIKCVSLRKVNIMRNDNPIIQLSIRGFQHACPDKSNSVLDGQVCLLITVNGQHCSSAKFCLVMSLSINLRNFVTDYS